MPTTIERIWAGDLTAIGGRKDKRSFGYQAFMPDRIADVDPRVHLRHHPRGREGQRVAASRVRRVSGAHRSFLGDPTNAAPRQPGMGSWMASCGALQTMASSGPATDRVVSVLQRPRDITAVNPAH